MRTPTEVNEYLQAKRIEADAAWKAAFKIEDPSERSCEQARAFGMLLGAIQVGGWDLTSPELKVAA